MASPCRLLIALTCTALAGCSTLLPSTRSDDVSRFGSYPEAQAALEAIIPYRTRLDDLARLRLDICASANVQQLPYPQWVGMLVQSNVPLDRADIGIRDCLAAEQACRAYVFRIGNLTRERDGNFFADFLNFRRVTRTRGWRFEGVVLVRDEVVLFRNHGGQPNIELVEDRSNPLGPLQTLGESLPSALGP